MALIIVDGSPLLKVKNRLQPSDEAEVMVITFDEDSVEILIQHDSFDPHRNLEQGLQEVNENCRPTLENPWREGDGAGGMEGVGRTEGGR